MPQISVLFVLLHHEALFNDIVESVIIPPTMIQVYFILIFLIFKIII